ncbi:hypothetical protein GOV09_03360 [Candidatus Woesearchaeota archaeon]|nr:hypothetical protein [Candidatus Woesearchaeota archaeon]
MKLKVIVLLLVLATAALYVAALPEGPSTLSVASSSRRIVTDASNVSALAGNVSQLNIAAQSTSQSWQGYYGNITGTLVLDTSSGFRLYEWSVANPSGEVYATTSITVPQWGFQGQVGNISCWNYTRGLSTSDYPHYAEVEGWNSYDGESQQIGSFGIAQNAIDAINNTFRRTSNLTFPTFYVGNQPINGTGNIDECPTLSLFNATNVSTYGAGEPLPAGPQEGGRYQEVILIDQEPPMKLLWTAIIDLDPQPGFNRVPWDFEMIVPEDGHGIDTATTEYNFYVELE